MSDNDTHNLSSFTSQQGQEIDNLLKAANDMLEQRLQKKVIAPLSRSLRHTQLALFATIIAIVCSCIAALFTYPSRAQVMQAFTERDVRIIELEAWRARAEITSPLTTNKNSIRRSVQIPFGDMTDLLVTMYGRIFDTIIDYEHLRAEHDELLAALTASGNEENAAAIRLVTTRSAPACTSPRCRRREIPAAAQTDQT